MEPLSRKQTMTMLSKQLCTPLKMVATSLAVTWPAAELTSSKPAAVTIQAQEADGSLRLRRLGGVAEDEPRADGARARGRCRARGKACGLALARSLDQTEG